MVAAVTRACLDPRPTPYGGSLGGYPAFRWKAER